MLNLIDQFRRQPTIENAKAIRDYFERNPARVWVLQSDDYRVIAAAGVRAVAGAHGR